MNKHFLVLSFLSILSTSAFAQMPQQNSENFAENKQQILDMMGKRENIIASDKTCVTAAQNKQALHQCMEIAKGSRQELRKEHQEFRQDRRENRRQK